MLYVEGDFYFEYSESHKFIHDRVDVYFMGYPISVEVKSYTTQCEFSTIILKLNISLEIEELCLYDLRHNGEKFVKDFLTLYFYETYGFKFLNSGYVRFDRQSNNEIYYQPYVNVRELGLFDTKENVIPVLKNDEPEIVQQQTKKRKIFIIEDDL